MLPTIEDIEQVTLPDDLQADLDRHYGRDRADEAQASGQDTLSRLAQILVDKRKEAIDGRAESGIEAIWDRCEELHAGIDDLNRSEATGRIKWQKPLSSDGPLVSDDRSKKADPTRSTVFVPVTARYVEAAAAKVAEILLPPDDKAFSFEATPVPDLISAQDDQRQLVTPDGIPLERPATDTDLASAGNSPTPPQAAPSPSGPASPAPPSPAAGAAPGPGMPPTVPLLVKDLAQEKADLAAKKAKKAEQRVYDWMVESKYAAEMRKVVFDAAKLGTGVLKGPFPTVKKSIAVLSDDEGTVQVQIQQSIQPGVKRISLWDFFPDPSCGEDVHAGDYCFERDRITERKLDALREEPGYIGEAIDQVIKEGPGKIYLTDDKAAAKRYDKRYEIWYYYGYLTREELLQLNAHDTKRHGEIQADLDQGNLKEMARVPCICTMVNSTIIRGVLNPLDSGEYPYHAVRWTLQPDTWAGKGVAESGETAQRIINSATRALLNNAGNTAGNQIVIDSTCIEPVNTEWQITPDKLWKKVGEDVTDDVKKAFEVYSFPNRGAALHAVIEYGFRLFEETTNIPLVTQGQSGSTTPQTLGGQQLQDSNANQMLRNVAYRFDDDCTEPVAKQFYEYLLLDPDVPSDEKGDFTINAHGSAALVERHIQTQVLGQMGNLTLNPAFELDPKKWIAEWLRGNKLDPSRLKYDDADLQQIKSQPPVPPPQVQAAQINAQAKVQTAQLQAQGDQADAHMEQQRIQLAHQERMAEIDAKTKLAMLQYATQRQISLEQVKADLADTTMKLNVQRELSAADRAMKQTMTPPTEPAGRAQPGHAFEQ